MSLILAPNISDPDGFYDQLRAAHEGLKESESHQFNTRLVLLLANHIGDREVLAQALEEAK